MPTPLMPDEELDALFRRGLEHYPEQPENPAAWHRMDLLLDADLRQQALRRKVLRLLGAESVLLVLLLWAAWVFVPAQLAADHGPATARLNQAAGADPGLASAGRGRLAQTSSANDVTAAQGNLLPEATSAEGNFSPAPTTAARSAAATKVSLAANAARDAVASEQSRPTSQLLAATSTEHRGNTRRHTKKGGMSATNKLASNDKSQAAATDRLTATAVRRGYSLALAAERRPAKRLVRRPRHNQKNTAVAATAYSAAGAAVGADQGRVSAAGRRSRQWPAAESSRSLAATTRPGQGADAASYGTAIDLLALRWPTPNFSFALPDSLRTVALAVHPAPADSLAPPQRPQRYRLQLGLVAAPELSAVRPSRLAPPGPSMGVQFDYRLARRWHLSTALLYSVKRYDAAGTDYTVPYTLPHGWVIRDVDAVCRIIDIPLNLRYDLWQRPRYQVFASAGLSSLLMKREQYTYNYDPVYGRPVPSYAIEVDNGSRHLLKVLNLSAGYERLLGPRWSVQAEAFAKLPLAGVGYGAVRLRSAGVFFSLRYGLLPGRPVPEPGLR